ncbi:MAG TPA: hypothetical protein VE669_03020 [Actinomycetota bacterium]|nr:hypothetical protein [Actinomycetota bacterium]
MHPRRILMPALTVAIALASATPAHAGGWDSLTFPRDHYLAGEVAFVSEEFFAGALKGTGSLDAGPYHAYLLPRTRDRGFGMIEPPNVPAGAIDLGLLSVSGPFVADDGYRYGRATLSFVVPDVPTGGYAIGFCDDPCTHSTIGWLAWGTITIVHTRYEAVLLRQLGRARNQASVLGRELRRSDHAIAELRADLARADARWAPPRIAEPAFVGLGPAMDASPGVREASVTPWLVLLAAVLGLGAGAALGRRRRSGSTPLVLDTVPAEIDLRERVDQRS